MSALKGELVTETFTYDGGRKVTAYVPPDPPNAVVYAADGGWHTLGLAEALEAADARSTMVVGVHGLDDDDGRLKEYVAAFGAERFDAYEKFFVDDVDLGYSRSWTSRCRRSALLCGAPPSAASSPSRWGSATRTSTAPSSAPRRAEVSRRLATCRVQSRAPTSSAANRNSGSSTTRSGVDVSGIDRGLTEHVPAKPIAPT